MMVPGEPLAAMASDGLVPLFSSGDPDVLYAAAEALVGAGISTFEVTLRSHGSLDALTDLLARADAEDLPLAIGAGTVMDPATAEAAINAGARFVFAPVVSAGIAAVCSDAGVPHVPGCATPTEIHTALELGCGTVKLFPADAIGGSGFLRAVRSVFPGVACIPSGGITPDAGLLASWFDAGAVAVAMGSQLFGSGGPTGEPDVASRLELAVAAVAAARREPPT
jgi:2-dehydro-3-deoxyphosphogluconate aldolase/(4S)-4-hydroxy-2-oxoglutarate aldolase